MYNVFKIVNWLRVRNNTDMQSNPIIDELSQMRAMKLLYYIQAMSLSLTGRRMFGNDIVARKYGPVVEEVHEKYRGNIGMVGEITESDLNDYSELQSDYKAFSILNSVYDVYGYSSAYDLMSQINSEKPWQGTPRNEAISDQVIKDYYSVVFVPDET